MRFEGYCEKLPIHSGDKITIKKGTMVRSRGESTPAGRTYKVTVHHVLNGYKPDAAEVAYQERHGNTAVGWNPKAIWAGAGGYWCEVDMNDVPEAQPPVVLTPRQIRIIEIENALKAGAGVFTGTLTNELEKLRREETEK